MRSTRLLLMGLLAFGVALVGTARAEVQNIRVSGDIDLKAMSYHNYDLKEKQLNFSHPGSVGAVSNDDDARFLLSTVHLQVDADLTDNVSATVRLLNQRVWDAQVTGDDSIVLDNAYVTLREFLYSPLTVIAGRQNLVYGNGFIVGNGRLADPEGTFGTVDSGVAGAGVHTGGIGQEHSAFNSFDAVRAILDYAPVTFEAVYAKTDETGAAEDDETLWGVVVTYQHDQWDAVIQPYWFWLDSEVGALTAGRAVTVNDATANGAARTYERNDIHTVGTRVALSPIENLRLDGEGAFQFGEMSDTTSAAVQERDRQAWAATVYANYTWVQAPWTPATGIGWEFFSGEEPDGNATAASGNDSSDEFNAWHPIYRGSYQTWIQDFFDGADSVPGIYTTVDANDTAGSTNLHRLWFDVNAKPMQDVTLWARYIRSWFDEAPRPGRDSHAGDELNVKALYDYTEDVQLAAWGAWFFPGDYYDGETNSATRADAYAWSAGVGGSVDF